MARNGRDGLVAAVHKARQVIGRLKAKGRRASEQDTKAVLIEPVLTALGWDVHDIEDVNREYRKDPRDNPVDYALLLEDSPLLFLEAKALSKDISERKWIAQTLNYANVVGVKWCVLTNGDDYRLYYTLAPGDVDDKLFRAAAVSARDDEANLLETLSLLSRERMQAGVLTALWNAHFVDRHVRRALAQMIETQDDSLVRLLRRRTEGLTAGAIHKSLARCMCTLDFSNAGYDAGSVVPDVPAAVPEPPVVKKPRRSVKPAAEGIKHVTLAQLIQAGLIKTPLALEKTYKGQRLAAEVQPDGSVLCAGQAYNSLSAAAGYARAAVVPPPAGREYHPTNGWTFWQYQDPATGRLQTLDGLRRAYHSEHRTRLEVV